MCPSDDRADALSSTYPGVVYESWASSDAARKTMQDNRGRDTKAELAERRLVLAQGLRYLVNRRLDAGFMDEAGIADVTPHGFQRTAATAINETGGLLPAAELLGHSDPKVTVQHYIGRSETVSTLTAGLLDATFSRAS